MTKRYQLDLATLFLLSWTIVVFAVVCFAALEEPSAPVMVVEKRDFDSGRVVNRMQRWVKTEIGLARFYPWLLFAPYVAYTAFRYPLSRENLSRSAPANLIAFGIFLGASQLFSARASLFETKILFTERKERSSSSFKPPVSRPEVDDVLVRFHHEAPTPPLPGMPRPWVWPLIVDLMAYGAIAGLAHSVYFHRQFRERERRALALESHLSQARLNALKAQLQPHFLFNSLNATVALLRNNPAQAEKTLVALSELLRMALSFSERQEISIREELEFVRRYVDIQRTRFGEKLRFEEKVAEDARECLLPTLSLQPLVENAIRHGIEPADRDGLVRLNISKNDESLTLEVVDDGVGFNTGASQGGAGIGLKNLRARLEALYGAEHTLEISSRPGEGARVIVKIPCRKA